MRSDINTQGGKVPHPHPEQKQFRNYTTWIRSLVVTALVFILWALYGVSLENGYVNNLLSLSQTDGKTGNNEVVNRTASGNTSVQNQVTINYLQATYHNIIDMVRPAVIKIDGATKTPPAQTGQAVRFDMVPRDIRYTTIGSGVIIDPRGYVLTNSHVIIESVALRATVYGPGGATEYPLKLVKADVNSDMALLRIQGADALPYAILGDSDAIRTGDMMLTIGSGFGFDQTVTSGMISSRNRTIQAGNIVYDNLLQTDTSINQGSSGGPMLNMRGEVIGINTILISPIGGLNGIGFAIPINRAAEMVGGVIDFMQMPPEVTGGQLFNWALLGHQVGNSYRLADGQTITSLHAARGNCIDCHPQLAEKQL